MRHPRIVVVASIFLVTGLLAGCSLITIQSEVEPLPPKDLEARLRTRDIVTVFADRVQIAVDEMLKSSEDADVRHAALRWRIGAIEAARSAGMRQDPREALVDVWALCSQQLDFLSSGAGSTLFGSEQDAAVAAAEQLAADVAQIASSTIDPPLRGRMETFVADYAARFPIVDLQFHREPVLPLWIAFVGEDGRVGTVGTTPEVMQDVADRLRVASEGLPQSVAWRSELLVAERQDEIDELVGLLERLDTGLASLAELAETSPELAAAAARELQTQLGPSLERLDSRWGESLSTLSAQREAIAQDLERIRAEVTKTVESERVALTEAVEKQRAAVMAEAGEIATDVTDRAMSRVQAILREGLVLLIILAAVVLGLPFAAGYFVGRARARLQTR